MVSKGFKDKSYQRSLRCLVEFELRCFVKLGWCCIDRLVSSSDCKVVIVDGALGPRRSSDAYVRMLVTCLRYHRPRKVIRWDSNTFRGYII